MVDQRFYSNYNEELSDAEKINLAQVVINEQGAGVLTDEPSDNLISVPTHAKQARVDEGDGLYTIFWIDENGHLKSSGFDSKGNEIITWGGLRAWIHYLVHGCPDLHEN